MTARTSLVPPAAPRCPYHGAAQGAVPPAADRPRLEPERRADWLTVPGDFAHPLSLVPLHEARRFNLQLGDYWREKQAGVHHAPVFKLHAGLRTIAFTDHRSGQFYFEAPRSVLEREPEQRFGFIALQQALTGGCHPALVSAGAQHDRSRALTDAILRHRGPAFAGALDRVCERVFAAWEAQGSFELFPALQDLTSAFAFEWLLEERPDPADIIAWQGFITTLVTDTPASAVAARALLPRPSAAARRAAQNLAALARRSRLFDDYRTLARTAGIADAELADFLVFLCTFNGSGAVTHSLFPSLAQLSINDAVREELLAELKGGTSDSAALAQLPWLDAIHRECTRLYTRPRLFYKRAMTTLGLPTNDGRVYRINQGDLLVAVMPVLHRDPTVFADADAFSPRRFLQDPALRERVFGYGAAPQGKNPYGCAAHKSGHAPILWKTILARLVGQFRWDLMQEPDFNINHFFEVAPLGLALNNFARRGAGTRDAGDDGLAARFRSATATVRGLKVSFDRQTYMRLYGLYKQALDGDNKEPRPGALNATARTKWDAWTAARGVGRREAMTEYAAIVEAKQASVAQAVPAAATGTTDQRPAGVGEDALLQCTVDSAQRSGAPSIDSTAMSGDGESARDYRLHLNLALPPALGEVGLSLVLVGEDGQTPTVRCRLQPPGGAGDVPVRRAAALRFSARCIGRPFAIRLGLSGAPGECLVETLTVSLPEAGASWRFLCHEHVPVPCEDKIILEASTLGPRAPAGVLAVCEDELARRRARYGWREIAGHELPAHADVADYDQLPRDERFASKHEWVSLSVLGAPPADERPAGDADLAATVETHRALFEGRELRPRVLEADRWRSNEEFGRALLHGSHCTYLRRCTALPEGFAALGGLSSVAGALAAGDLYCADYAVLEGVTPYPGRYLAAPTVLLRADRARRCLLPVAIRVTREEGAPIFTPEDSEADWLTAKLWARLADVTVQQIVSHFLECHAVIEAFAVAAQRTLPTAHPVYQLLAPHLKHAIAINVLARKYLLAEGGLIDSIMSIGGDGKFALMSRAYQRLSLVETLALPRDLRHRGVDGDDGLDYHYRDDARLLWEATATYVDRIVGIFYGSDDDVARDRHLQAWLTEFNTRGYPRSDLPRALTSKAALAELLAGVIFTASAKHATHNYMQYESYALSLFTPASLFAPPPQQKGQSTTASLAALLPPPSMIKRVIEAVTLLSMRFAEDVPLGGDPVVRFGDPAARMAAAQFRDALRRIEGVLAARNQDRAIAYDVLLPSRVPNGVVL